MLPQARGSIRRQGQQLGLVPWSSEGSSQDDEKDGKDKRKEDKRKKDKRKKDKRQEDKRKDQGDELKFEAEGSSSSSSKGQGERSQEELQLKLMEGDGVEGASQEDIKGGGQDVELGDTDGGTTFAPGQLVGRLLLG